ncbi:MAG: hypothetical protein JWN45_1311 [Acidobacteriaceae bacterium]|nr:hypothetical protein [Acidobacteriaceae bacterium]
MKKRELEIALARIMPDATEDLIDTLSHDLSDFLEIAENHKRRVEAILKLQGPSDKTKLAELLEDLLYGDILAELPYHMDSMQEILPKLIETLEDKSNSAK